MKTRAPLASETEKEARKRLAAVEAREKEKPALFTDVGGRKIRGAPIPKPCPFCGSNKWVSVYMQIEGKNGARSVYAATCGNRHFVEGPGGSSLIEACKLWNKRTTRRR